MCLECECMSEKRGIANLYKEVTVSLFGRYIQAALQSSTYAILH
jgi:hypothetical protein